MKKKTAFLFAILVLTSSRPVWASEVQVAGIVDKNHVQVDEEVSFTIKILGAQGNVQAPRLPAFQGFESFYTGRTSQFTFVNGKSSNTLEFNYVLVPKVMGKFTLNPVEVWIEGRRYQTESIQLEVQGPQVQPGQNSGNPQPAVSQGQTPPSAASAQSVGAPTELIKDDNVFVKALADKTTVYPNEQIVLTYTLFTRYDTRYEGFEEEPSVSGFWIEDFPLDKDLGRDTVSMNGKRYVKADIRKIALFPTASAQYTIQPGTLKVSIREQPKTNGMFDEFFDDSFFSNSGFFARRMERILKPDPITITVRPFPEKGKPKSFNGAVGQFRLTASVDKPDVKQNEPVSLKLVIEGEGNIETLAKPNVPELTGFKIYDGDSSSELFKTGNNVGGRKTFEIIFIPTEAGNLSIPPLEFSFFDPRRETYQTLQSQAFPLHVTPSNEPLHLPQELAEREAFKKDIRLEAKDIRYIHEEFPSETGRKIQSFVYAFLAAGNVLALLGLAAVFLQRRREEVFSRDIALKRRSLARQIAEKRLKKLKQLAQSKNPEEADRFLGEAEKILNEYLSNKFNVSAYQLTRPWIEEKLAEALGPEDPLLKKTGEFYELASVARYGKGALPVEERREFIHFIVTLIRRIERIK